LVNVRHGTTPRGVSIGLAALLASGVIAGITSAGPSPPAQKGLASVYSDHLNGQKTASGERYDSRGLTAAHRTLPLGAEIRVTNLANGRSVQVRINDRGPHVQGRIVDLSSGAAAALGMRTGVARVRLEILSQPAEVRTDTPSPP
jgi:rare lipoprotein A